MRIIFNRLLLLIAFLTGILGIFNYSIQYQLLNPQLYQDSLDQSGVFSVITDVVEDVVSENLITLQKGVVAQVGQVRQAESETPIADKIMLTLLNTLIENQTPKLVETIMVRVDFQGNIRQFTFDALAAGTGFLKGEREPGEFFDKIPDPEDVIAFRDASLNQLLYQLTSNRLGSINLPVCTSQSDIQANLNFIREGNPDRVICTNNQIQPLLDAAFGSSLVSGAVGGLETDVQTQFDNFGVTRVIDGMYETILTLSNFKVALLKWQGIVQTNEKAAINLLLISLITLFVGASLKKENRLRALFRTSFYIGLSVLIISIIYKLILSEALVQYTGITRLESISPVLDQNQNLALLSSINSAVSYFYYHVIDLALVAGFCLTVFTGALWLILDLAFSKNVQKTIISLGMNLRKSLNNLVIKIKNRFGLVDKSKKKSAKKNS